MRTVRGKVYAADLMAIGDDHSVEWLRGCRTVGVASPDLDGVVIGEDVVVIPADVYDALVIARTGGIGPEATA